MINESTMLDFLIIDMGI